ncbi:hypothetical protein DFH07DRAFT_963699 [Mycena maculata]|uniref:Uncharacterized protein n=1 Tax=Mycena maculata TaxID=230809 RepID=A0AAD7IM81_9AGAR|nr:hypothetical protein DFH07DRAFT_963699 [Mycena maculata]
MTIPQLRAFIRHGTPLTTAIVVNVLKRHPTPGLTTIELYEKAHQMYPHAFQAAPPPKNGPSSLGKKFFTCPDPPKPTHPIRSVRYLKSVVLKELEELEYVQKIVLHLRDGTPTSPGPDTKAAWRWILSDTLPEYTVDSEIMRQLGTVKTSERENSM